ncbi:hypothetical protein D3C80_1512990 [compost metagenome]
MVVISPCSMPNSRCSTWASGARQLVVHEALEMIWCEGRRMSWLTPYTTVASAPLAGAEIMTLPAPAVRWAAALARSVNSPVHSNTTSMASAFHGSSAGLRMALTAMRSPLTVMLS